MNKHGSKKNTGGRDKLDTGDLKGKVADYQAAISRVRDEGDASREALQSLDAREKDLDSSGTPDDIQVFVKDTAAARYLGITKQKLSYHVTQGNINRDVDGHLTSTELDRWSKKYQKGLKSTASGSIEEIDIIYKTARANREKVRAKREEIILEQVKGSLLSWTDFERAMVERINIVKNGLNLFRSRLSPLLVGKDQSQIMNIIQEEVDILLTAFSEHGEYGGKLDEIKKK